MRRWNGWGNPLVEYPLPAGAREFLVDVLGPGLVHEDASQEDVLNRLPASGIDTAPGLTTDPLERLMHAHGQSLPDWIALRSGQIGRAPDGVAHPTSAEHVRELLQRAGREGWRVIPYGGGTSVVGHINPLAGRSRSSRSI